MAPTLASGSLFVYDQTYYHRNPIRSGEVVLIRHDRGLWVKRVYAVEGENFWTLRERMPDGQVRRDPIAPGQEQRYSEVTAQRRKLHHLDVKVVRLRLLAGQLFLVGDGAWSQDSRTLGPLAHADVVGRVIELPGQRLSEAPDHIELSSPKLAAKLVESAAASLTGPAAGQAHRTQSVRPELLRSAGVFPATPDDVAGAMTISAAGG